MARLGRQSYLLIVLIFTSLIAHAQTPPFPASEFFQRNGIDDMKISPDGRHVAISFGQDRASRLEIVDLVQRKANASFITALNSKVDEYYWVNNERIVASTLTFQGGLEIPFLSGEIFGFNIDNSRKFQLVGYGTGDDEVFFFSHLLPNDPNHIRVTGSKVRSRSIARSRPTSYLLDVYAEPSAPGRRTQANLSDIVNGPLPWGDLYSDSTGEVRLAIANDDENIIQVRYREKNSNEWLDIGSQLTGKHSLELKYMTFVGFAADNESFYYISRGEHSTQVLYQYDPSAHASTVVFQHEQFDIEAENIVFSNTHDAVIGVKFHGDVLEQHYFSDHPDALLHQRLDATFPGELVELTSVTLDGTKGFIGVYGPQRLGDYYLLDTATMQIEYWGGSSSRLPPERMATVTPFAVKTPDDLVVHGHITTPLDATGPMPMIVIPHGGPIGVRDLPLFDREAQYFAHHGYAVLQVNYRGSGGFGGDFQDAGARQWGLGMIDDITLAARWAVQKEIADPTKICIYGGSYGAYAALTSVVREPERYRCAVGYAGVYDLTRMDRSDIPFQPGGEDYIKTFIGGTEEFLQQQSPEHNAAAIKVPVFLAHGGVDRRAPVFHAKDMARAMERAGVEHELLIHDGEGHGFYSSENELALYERMLAFFDKHLKGESASAQESGVGDGTP
ncbi:MAG: prolyl oligopeptidase family serine peptidase [Pseudomonadota bacterium]